MNTRIKWIEYFYLIAQALIIGFLFTFNFSVIDSGEGGYVLNTAQWILYSIAGFIVLFLYVYIQKTMLAWQNIEHKVSLSVVGVAFSVAMGFVSRGALQIYVPVTTFHKANQHTGTSRQESYLERSIPSCVVSIGSMVLLGAFAGFLPVFGTAISRVAFQTAIMAILPLDFLLKMLDRETGLSPGSILLFESRKLYIFMLAFVFFACVGAWSGSIWYTLIFSVIVAFLFAAMYYLKFEAVK